jgi:very-short-patch-repair endonuclease
LIYKNIVNIVNNIKMDIFTRNLEELSFLTMKDTLVSHLKKNYKENIHYISKKHERNKNDTTVKKQGGHNKMDYFLTDYAFELLRNSYNLRNRYLVDVNNNIKQFNITMCIENQTIGFIENAYKDTFNVKRQYKIGKYRADLYFIDYKLVIECDEFNHEDRDQIKEKLRDEYMISLGNKIIRYNPNEKIFDLSNVLKQINKILFSK